MLSRKEIEAQCCNTINTILFADVWNEPCSEFRTNIKPLLYKQNSCTGSFSVTDANIPLPAGTYYVWVMAASDFPVGTKLPVNTWVSLKDICNEWNTLIHMYTSSGYIFCKDNVYFRYNTSRNVIFIIANKKMLNKIPAVDLNSVYLTLYYDSDQDNNIQIECFQVEATSNFDEYYKTINDFMANVTNMDQFICLRNGKEVIDMGVDQFLAIGDYIELINDKNILFSFEVDVTNDSENPSFLSEMDKTWKQLIHIPRDKNPNNEIFTHNTCDFFIRTTFGNSGLYVHRIGERTVNQVTHNDMAIPLFVVDAYRDYLAAQEIKIRGIVRRHDKDNKLIRDASYIDLLYTDVHSDEDIIKILCGKGPENIPWWKASELEQSTYVKMMFDTPNVATVDNMKEYVDALGFYQVVNLLCRRIIDVSVTDTFSGVMTLPLPVLYTGLEVIPIVYLNGKSLLASQFKYKVDLENNFITIGISENLYIVEGDLISVVLYITGNNKIYKFVPTENIRTIEVPFEDFRVYKEYNTHNSSANKGVNKTSALSYELLQENTNQFIFTKNDSGATSITFSESLIGTPVYIQNKFCSYIQDFDLSSYTATGKTIAIPLNASIFDSTDSFPMQHIDNISVYLNDSYLVKGIDYIVATVKDEEGRTSFSELIIQSMDYFVEGKIDTLRVVINVAEVEDISNGFAVYDELRDPTPVNLYFPNISVAHVGGKLERYGEYRGTYIKLPEGKYPVGSIFEIQTSVPKLVKDFILDYAANQDLERIKILNEYFYPHGQIDLPILVLESKHRIYSVLINTLIYDILTGKTILVDDPDENRMREQIAPYLYLKDMDICFTDIDKRFIDFYPQYVNYEIPVEYKRVIDRFITLFMPENESPSTEVVYE